MGKSAKVKDDVDDDGNGDENDSSFFSSELMPVCHLVFPFPFHFTEKKSIDPEGCCYLHSSAI